MSDPNTLNYFELFALPIKLNIDEETLRKTFYDLSRTFHPDAVASEKADIANQSSALINLAYQTLKNKTSRSQYVLSLSGKKQTPSASKVPVDLAEQYFELQDLLTDNKQITPLVQFKQRLESMLDANAIEWMQIAQEFDEKGKSDTLLSQLEDNLLKARYLQSMLTDIDANLLIETKDILWQ